MAGREWSLVAFTLLAQMAVALVLALGLVHVGALWALGAGLPEQSLAAPLGAGLVLLVLAAACSLFHLGRPLGARRALANLRGSWLSREILMLVGLGGGVLLLWCAVVARAGPPWFWSVLAAATAIFGVGLVASMARDVVVDMGW